MTVTTEILQLIRDWAPLLGLLVLYFKVILGIKLDIKELQTQIKPFVVMIERDLPKILHSDNTPETDRILEKLDRGEYITLDEIRELKHRLICHRQNGDYAKWLELPAAMFISHLQGMEDKRVLELGRPTKTLWSRIISCLK